MFRKEKALKKIDAHVHFCGNHPDCLNRLRGFDIRLMNICVAHPPRSWEKQRVQFRTLARQYPQTFTWCTTFDPPDFKEDDGDYARRVIDGLRADFSDGAVACKIWKNVGMEAKRPNGDFVLPDDPVFDPILDFIEHAKKPVLMHIAEPLACWRPLDERSPHYHYYRDNPEWHMYGKPGFPSHEELIAARDNVLERHPGIQFIGAHLGSLEYDVDEVARRLDRYPNFAVDTSARMKDLMIQDGEKVAAFLTKYRTRVMYGSDYVDYRDQSEMPEPARSSSLESLFDMYKHEIDYLISSGPMAYSGYQFNGIALSEPVAHQILYENAHRLYGIS